MLALPQKTKNINPPSTKPINGNMGCSIMSFTEKIDVLDMLINILKEHEETIDQLITRLETVANRLPNTVYPPTNNTQTSVI